MDSQFQNNSPGARSNQTSAADLSALSVPAVTVRQPAPVEKKIRSALKKLAKAENFSEESAAGRRLNISLKNYEKHKVSGAPEPLPGKLLALAYLELGSYFLERPKFIEQAERALLEGLRYCKLAGGHQSWHLLGIMNLAKLYLAQGEQGRARQLCEQGLQSWDRTDLRYAQAGLSLLTYGEVLEKCRQPDLAWRQFEAAKEYFGGHRQIVRSDYSEHLYMSAMVEWGRRMLTLPQQSLEKFLGLAAEMYFLRRVLLGDDHAITIGTHLEVAKAQVLIRDYLGAEHHCTEIEGQLDRLCSREFGAAACEQEETRADSLEDNLRLAALSLNLSETLTLRAIASHFLGRDRLALELLFIAHKHASDGQDQSGQTMAGVFSGLAIILQHRRRNDELGSLQTLFKKTREQVF